MKNLQALSLNYFKKKMIHILGCALFLLSCATLAGAATHVSGTIDTDTTWTVEGSPYIVTANIIVQGTDGTDGITTLTIEAGVQVRFAGNYYLDVGRNQAGALVAQGTSTHKIVFTSNNATPAAGDWSGIRFSGNSDDATCVLQHCIIEYAGFQSNGYAVFANNASPALVGCTISHSQGSAILTRSPGSGPTIDGCHIRNCENFAIYATANSSPKIMNNVLSDNARFDIGLNDSTNVRLTGNTMNSGIWAINAYMSSFTDNTFNMGNYSLRLHPDNVGQLFSSNTINNVTDVNLIKVSGGTIRHDATWSSLMPYRIEGNIVVEGTDGDDNITTLTISAGVEISFRDGYQVAVGTNSGNPGALVANGEENNPILFTAANPKAAGKWKGLYFDNTTDDATTRLEHCIIEYAGDNVGYGKGAVYIGIASPRFINCELRYGLGNGFYIKGNNHYRPDETQPVISGCTISGFEQNGIYLDQGRAAIDGGTFSGNGKNDIYLNNPEAGGVVTNSLIVSGIRVRGGGSLASFKGNEITYNDSRPLHLHPNNVGELFAANTIAGGVTEDSHLCVQGGTISRDATWAAVMPYRIDGSITIQGSDGPDGVTTLTIEPGGELRFSTNTSLAVGYASSASGALVARGTANRKILFTSRQSTPVPGDWENIIFYDRSDDATSILDHCIIEFGGGSNGGLFLSHASPTIQNTTIRHCKNAGLYATGIGCQNSRINCNTFMQNDEGIYWKNSPVPEIHKNNFISNTGHGLHYAGSVTMNAKENWWNTDQGPNAGGSTFSGNVDADPWSTSVHACTGQEENQAPNTPANPSPADGAVRVSTQNGVTMSWRGGDPNPNDVVAYDLYWGLSPDNLSRQAAELNQTSHNISTVEPGATHYWQIIAKDDKGAETTGPVWHLTSDGDPPDLIISGLTTDPEGSTQSGQSVTLTATVQNTGSGPAVDAFEVEFIVDGTSIGTATVDTVMLSGTSVTASRSWTYSGGDPTIEIVSDSAAAVTETNEQNNTFTAQLSEVADNTAPTLVNTSPTDGAHLQQIQNITTTLTDAQGAVDDTAVINSFSVVDGGSNAIPGTTTESGDTFTFVPATLPLTDSIYTVSLTAADTYGNTRNYQFAFTIDTTPPAKPIITGGNVASGTIQARPEQNTADQFIVELTGSRDPGTSVWVNGIERIASGNSGWSVQITLLPGDNPVEIWLEDLSGNIGPSEWVDITINTGNRRVFDYDGAGRVRRVTNQN